MRMSRSTESARKANFAATLRTVREVRGLTQEEFDVVSGRTYLSAVERGLKIPTLGKIEDLASVLMVHPATLIALSYCKGMTEAEFRAVWEQVASEGLAVLNALADKGSNK